LEMSRWQGTINPLPYSGGPRRARPRRLSDEKYLGPFGDSGESLAGATCLGLECPVRFANGRNRIAGLRRLLSRRKNRIRAYVSAASDFGPLASKFHPGR